MEAAQTKAIEHTLQATWAGSTSLISSIRLKRKGLFRPFDIGGPFLLLKVGLSMKAS